MEHITRHARVESDLPGRIRVRLGISGRNKENMQQLHNKIEHQAGISRVDTNSDTGSVMIHYNKKIKSHAELMSILHDAGIIVKGTAAAVGLEVPDTGQTKTSDKVISALTDLDKHLRQLTGRRIDLKLLFPLVLTAIGIRRLLTSGLGIAEVPAYLLLWYAFDSFWKLHNLKQVN
jgi:hypothetical protein